MADDDTRKGDPEATRRRSDLLKQLESLASAPVAADQSHAAPDPNATRRRADLIAAVEAPAPAEPDPEPEPEPEPTIADDTAMGDVEPASNEPAEPASVSSIGSSTPCPGCGRQIRATVGFCPRCGVDLAAKRRIRASIKSATIGALVTGVVVAGLAFGIGASMSAGNDSAAVSRFEPQSTSSYEPATTEPYIPSTTGVISTKGSALSPGTAGGYVLTGSDSSGYSSRVTLSVDQPMKVAAASSSSSLARKVLACSVDPSTDAVVPIRVQITNTTSNFPSVLGVTLSTGSSNADIASDVRYSDGPTCISPQTSSSGRLFGLQYNDQIAPGASATSDFFLVLYGYYSPNLPSGDAAGYSSLTVIPSLSFGDTDTSGARRATPAVTALGTNAGPIFQMPGATPSPTTPTTGATRSGTSSYTVGAELNLRTGPGTSYSTLGLVPDGTSVTVQCAVEGEQVDGRSGADSWWVRVTYQGSTGYLSNGFVYTGNDITNRTKIPHC